MSTNCNVPNEGDHPKQTVRKLSSVRRGKRRGMSSERKSHIYQCVEKRETNVHASFYNTHAPPTFRFFYSRVDDTPYQPVPKSKFSIAMAGSAAVNLKLRFGLRLLVTTGDSGIDFGEGDEEVLLRPVAGVLVVAREGG